MNKMIKTAATAAALSLMAGTTAFAEDIPTGESVFESWGEAGGFNIFVDTTRGTCMAERGDEFGYVIQMGMTEEEGVGYLGVFTSNETSIGNGKEDLLISIGDNLYTAESRTRANLSDEYSGGYLRTNNPAFVKDIMEQKDMVVFAESDSAFTVSLDGTMAAIEAARECMAEQAAN